MKTVFVGLIFVLNTEGTLRNSYQSEFLYTRTYGCSTALDRHGNVALPISLDEYATSPRTDSAFMRLSL